MDTHVMPLQRLSFSDQYLFNTFGRGPSTPTKFATVHAAILHHAALQPDSIAVQDLSLEPARVISYGSLIRAARYMAASLKRSGVTPGARVPVVAKRSIELVVAIIGVLLCGAQYVPLDGGVVPYQTLRHVLDQAADEVVLALSQFAASVRSLGFTKVLLLDGMMEQADITGCDVELESTNPPKDDGCYVIYTSGTTGIPKGVHVTHANVTNLLCNEPGNIGMRPGLRVGQVLSISFDMGAWEILGSLVNGCTLVLRGSDWLQTLRKIDILISTPTILSKFDPAQLPNIKVVATAGEVLPQSTADAWVNAGKLLFMGSGPTEVTIVNTLGIHVPGKPVSIGKPTPNNNVYVLNEDLDPVPIGEVGLMWAGGKGVTSGYIAMPELTSAKWLPDPYLNEGSMMFNTGDLGRWRPDGNLEILGRQDDQVKIKGFRVELDGISASVASCPGVTAAAVVLADKRLCAFVQPDTCDASQIQKHVQITQPYYAIPEKVFPVQDFKLTVNGKTDKKALKQLAVDLLSRNGAIQQEEEKSKARVDIENVSTWSVIAPSKHSLSSSSTLDVTSGPGQFTTEVPTTTKLMSILRYRIFIVYRRLFSALWVLNIIGLVVVLALPWINRDWLTRLFAINLTIAVLCRQDYTINALYNIACSVPRSWPLGIRVRCAKIYHLGGVHSGAASAAVVWFLIGLVHKTERKLSNEPADRVSEGTLVTGWIAAVLLMIVAGSAWPSFRKAHHNAFEMIHRFVGWTALLALWGQTLFSIHDGRSSSQSFGSACVSSMSFWLLLASTVSIAMSWITLRKVKVVPEALSDHAFRIHFDYAVPVNGTFTRLSERPLLEWHSFATIPAPESKQDYPRGYSLIISNAGDWTKRQIRQQPRQMWVRGVPTCGVMRIATLFNRLVLVCTGSGIGPMLGFIQSPTAPFRLFWSTASPNRTFGDDFCADIRKSDPDAVIHDTKAFGRPDMVKTSYSIAQDFKAEAVVVIANEKITKQVVFGLEAHGIAAYGAIWDS